MKIILIFFGIIVLFGILIVNYVGYDKVLENVKKEPFSSIVLLANIGLVAVTTIGLYLTYQSNERASKIFVGQNKPLIDVTPIGVRQETGLITFFRVTNYSGFKAYNIKLDLKYDNNSWIGEWLRARQDKNAKGDDIGFVKNHFYSAFKSESNIAHLDAGESIKNDVILDRNQPIVGMGGDYKPEYICEKRLEGITMEVRIIWENSKGAVFDEIHQYRMICTRDNEDKDPGSGRAITFIPLGIVSKKNAAP